MVDHDDCYRTIRSQKSTSDNLIGIFCRVLLDFFVCIIDARLIPDKILHRANLIERRDITKSKEYFFSKFNRQNNRIRTTVHNNAMNDMSESWMRNAAEIKGHTGGYKEWQKSQLPLYSSETILCQIVLSLSLFCLLPSSLLDELSTIYSWLVVPSLNFISPPQILNHALMFRTSIHPLQQLFVVQIVPFHIRKNQDWAYQ